MATPSACAFARTNVSMPKLSGRAKIEKHGIDATQVKALQTGSKGFRNFKIEGLIAGLGEGLLYQPSVAGVVLHQ